MEGQSGWYQRVRGLEGERDSWEGGTPPEGEGGDSKYKEYTEARVNTILDF